MNRRHLFEFEDLEWWPQPLRNYVTEYLAHVITQDETYAPVIDALGAAFQRSGARRFVDFCSGSGSTSLSVLERVVAGLPEPVEIVLTDKFPNLERLAAVTATRNNCSYAGDSVDALDVPPILDGFRTLFTALHHFQPPQVRKILENAVDSRSPIAAFEFTERRVAQVAMGLALIPALSLLVTPRIRPITVGRLFWTYLLPVVPLTCTWDGMVSSIRSYTPTEMLDLARCADPRGRYEWTASRGDRRHGHAPFRVTALIGIPK